jgi:hypothetical protein
LYLCTLYGSIVQLDRISDFGSEGWGFESSWGHQRIDEAANSGFNIFDTQSCLHEIVVKKMLTRDDSPGSDILTLYPQRINEINPPLTQSCLHEIVVKKMLTRDDSPGSDILTLYPQRINEINPPYLLNSNQAGWSLKLIL